MTESLAKRALTLNDEQSAQMAVMTRIINEDFGEVVESVVQDCSENASQREAIRHVWQQDCATRMVADRAAFQADQSKNATSQRGNRWSPISYRIALAVYARSPAAYKALLSFGLLQLPSIYSVKKASQKYSTNPGVCHEYLEQQQGRYEEFKDEKLRKGEKVPIGEGVLIFDEVKVIDKMLWNSKNHKFVGIAMDETEYAYIADTVKSSEPKEPCGAEYILQFLWRDLSSNFDMIGPYYMSEKSVDHGFLTGCLFETMRAMHAYGFKVSCLVCDGASTNLTVMKNTLGISGPFNNLAHDFAVETSFSNPFDSSLKCHWLICPSHQLKNMVSALHSSQDSGCKHFIRNKIYFGWHDIKAMKARDDHRYENGQIVVVRGLLQSYIDRDSWTKLNVKPSKIMQQEEVLEELFAYANSNEVDSCSAGETLAYLQALNKIFERGFLAKKAMFDDGSPVLRNVEEGYTYFVSWLQEILRQNPAFSLTASKGSQSPFLAWQTWDLLRICVFGLKALLRDFTSRNKGYFLMPSRINGSAVESLFSQIKYATGAGKLSSANYDTSKRAVIVRANVHSEHAANVSYRDNPLVT